MTIIDPETGEILTGEISTPTEEALKAEKRYYQKMFSNNSKKHRLIRKYKKK